MNGPPAEEKLLSTNQVSKYLVEKYGAPAAISISHLYSLVTIGGGPERVRVGRRVGYYPSALDKWHLQRCKKLKSREPLEKKDA